MKKIDETIEKYVEWVEITEDEFNAAKEALPTAEFVEKYSKKESSGFLSKTIFKKAVYPTIDDIQYLIAVETLDEMKKLRVSQQETHRSVNIIKIIMVVFLIITIISFILSAVSTAALTGAMRLF